MMLVFPLFFLCLLVVKVKAMVECHPSTNCLTCRGVSYNCATCRKGYYFARGGAYFTCNACPPECSECDHYLACTACNEKNRYGSDCKRFVCSKGCLNSTCEPLSGTCLCQDNYEGGHCDYCKKGRYGFDGDCKNECPATCYTCISDKNCTECKDGFYGNTCDDSCPRGCYLGRCSQNNGTCYQNKCSPDFDGTNCSQCSRGRYGNDCKAKCPENCVACSSETACDQCKDGFWGDACEHNCSNGCLAGVCLKQSGSCHDDECRNGFVGEKCDRCISGRHGLNCSINETTLGKDSSASTIDFQVCLIVHAVLVLLCVMDITGTIFGLV